jgi:hypothetical protein
VNKDPARVSSFGKGLWTKALAPVFAHCIIKKVKTFHTLFAGNVLFCMWTFQQPASGVIRDRIEVAKHCFF